MTIWLQAFDGLFLFLSSTLGTALPCRKDISHVVFFQVYFFVLYLISFWLKDDTHLLHHG